MTTHEIMIDDVDVVERVREALAAPPNVFLLQLPSVFGLFTAPTRAGAKALDRIKSRLPGKTYGTAAGDVQRFVKLAQPGALAPRISDPADWAWLENSFIRFTIGPDTLDTPAVRRGTHQALLLPQGPHRRLFTMMEAQRLGDDDGMFGDHRCDALLCSSANRSGHPDGSITELDPARDFASANGVPLLVRSPQHLGPRGSYPIVWFDGDEARIERRGPGVEALEAELHARGLRVA